MNLTLKHLLIRTMTVIILSVSAAAAFPGALNNSRSMQEKFAALETTTDGRIGIYAINTANNTTLQYRAHERFPMGCTSKVIGVAAVLKQSMMDKNFLAQRITYTKEDLMGWTPITKTHVADGMSVEDLSAAAIIYSDNTAMNILIKKLGGLTVVNNFARSIGDNIFSLDNMFPDEATSNPGDIRNTTTPAAMAETMQRLVIGNALGTSQRKKLQTWLIGDIMGYNRIRAGVPKGWLVGDKTGTGSNYGTTNDIAVIWPPKCAPIVLAIYFTQNKPDAVKREDVLASATRTILSNFAKSDLCVSHQLLASSGRLLSPDRPVKSL